jgi:hypothetical protein
MLNNPSLRSFSLQILRSGPLLMGMILADAAGTNCSAVAATNEQIAT